MLAVQFKNRRPTVKLAANRKSLRFPCASNAVAFAGKHAWRSFGFGFAGRTGVLYFFSMFFRYRGHGFVF
jgi:hypothetical protein